jgi:hypothetical protein
METFTMDMAKLQELANEFAKDIKTQHDLNDFSKMYLIDVQYSSLP